MITATWGHIALICFGIYCCYDFATSLFLVDRRTGKSALRYGGTWVSPMNVIGIALILIFHFSPWHILWWRPLGAMVIGEVVKRKTA
jgi:hypothetical protein